MKLFAQTFKKGFTLIELLVVIAVIGVLAAIVLLAVNPAEQLARSRDTLRVSAATQVGRALQSYYTVQNPSAYPPVGTWSTDLTTAQDLKVMPGAVTGGTACVTNVINATWCYKTAANEAIVYTRLESVLYTSKCTTATDEPFWVFSTAAGKAGGVCATTGVGNEPASGVTTFNF